jgi:hypothetical protein
MTYARRFIDVTFSGGSAGTITFNARGKYALRTSARILHAGGFNYGTLELMIRGLSLQHISQLSTYGRRFLPDPSYMVQVDAGDDINGMSTVFIGSVRQAWGDMRSMPDCPFHVLATMNIGASGGQGNASSKPIKPSSYAGPTDVAMMIQRIASQVGLSFENNNVNVKLADPYHWGSPWKQMKEIMDAAGIEGAIDNGVMKIWPKSGNSSSGGDLFISPQTGMRDYPSFTEYGVQVRYEFHKAIPYGSLMTIQSDIKPANGTWKIIRIDYDLQSNTPKGNWFAVLDGTQLGAPVTQL